MTDRPALIARIDALEAQIEQLETALRIDHDHLPTRGPRLTPSRARMLALLVARAPHVVPREALLAARTSGCDPLADPKLVDVQICHLRRALVAAGLPRSAIAAGWGEGYRIPAKHLPAVRAAFWDAELSA
jgi:DNA-binding response OmpR family regulator